MADLFLRGCCYRQSASMTSSTDSEESEAETGLESYLVFVTKQSQ